ncbi:hypothetical protein D5S17_24340 [Pseudonocardiaceae bacterium YIM PH 21723]|nr:hypothetical protein D5S17_24340 [Pseudonocardiaceae bacterium YIM PH 21723]
MTTSGVEAVLDALLDGVTEAVIVTDSDEVVLMCNATARRSYPSVTQGTRLVGLVEDASAEGIVRGRLSGQAVSGRRQPVGDKLVAWYLSGPEADQERFLADAAVEVARSTDRAPMAAAVARLAAERVATDCVLVLPSEHGRLEWWRSTPEAHDTGRLTPRAVRKNPVLAPIVAGDKPNDVHPAWQQLSFLFAKGTPVKYGPLAVPLQVDDELIGVLLLVQRINEPLDLDLARRYADRMAPLLRTVCRLDEQSKQAELMRAELVPSRLPDVNGVRFASIYRTANRSARIGGDFYDVYTHCQRDAFFVLGDVCGNGVEAAVLAGQVRQSISALLTAQQHPSTVLRLLNEVMLLDGDNRFTTMIAGSVEVERDRRLRVVLSGGGHPPPFVLRADGGLEEVAVPGTVVGIIPEAQFGQVELLLAPGDVLLLYTDGITEARPGLDPDGELFGEQRLAQVFAAQHGRPLGEMVSGIEKVVLDWLGDRDHDDIALFALTPEG